MNINPFLSFKANAEIVKPKTAVDNVAANSQAPSNSAVSTNPIKQSTELSDVSPTYNVQVPIKYSYLGKQELPCSTTASLYKLENGQKVVIIPKEGSTVVKTYVNVGSMNEPDHVRGISHFIEHNLFNGSKGLEPGEFFDTVNKIGASTNASTGFAATDYYISSHLLKKNDLESEVKIHGAMIDAPRFALNMIEKEKGPVTSEINMILDDPENLAMNNTLKLLYNIKSTSKDIIGGNVDNINKITRDDVVDYYQRNYYPANMTTVITGEVDPDKAIALVSKYFNSKATPSNPRKFEELKPIEKTVRNDLISDKATSTIISMAFNGPKNTDTKDKILLDAMQYFLIGSSISRLNRPLQQVHTNAIVNSERISNKSGDNRVIMFQTATSEGSTENVLKTIYNEISSLEKNPPTEQELDIVKKKLKLGLAQMFESSESVNAGIGEAMLDNDLACFADFESVIENMTSKDIVDFSKKYLDLNKVAITVVHPASTNADSINTNYKKSNNVSFTGNSDEVNHKQAIDMSKVKQYGITNNFSVVTNDIKSNMGAMTMDLTTAAPADIKPALGNVLAIMLNRGSGSKDEKTFFTQLEKQGIETGFSADRCGIYVSSNFLPSDAVSAIKSAKEVLLNPRFTQEELDYAKRTITEALQNTPKSSEEGLLTEMFKGQFYGESIPDMLKGVNDITLADVKGLHQYIMNNAQGRVVMSAPFEKNPELKESMLDELCKDFHTLKPAKPNLFDGYKPVNAKKVVVQEDNKSQAEIQMGYKFKTNGNLKDNVVFSMLNIVLGGTPSSRLFADLREKQKLAYRVNSQMTTLDNSGVMSLYIKTTTDNAQTGEVNFDNLKKSVDGFKYHTQKLMNEPVSESELESAKLTLKNEILDGAELTPDKNQTIMGGLKSFYGAQKNNQALELIDKITAKDLQDCAKYIFSTNPTLSVVATKNTIENNEEYLKSFCKASA